MSDLQCPARFLLVHGEGPAVDVDVRLAPGADPLAQLEDLADVHRGETLVVEVPPEVVDALPRRMRPTATGPARVEVDADGWRSYHEPYDE